MFYFYGREVCQSDVIHEDGCCQAAISMTGSRILQPDVEFLKRANEVRTANVSGADDRVTVNRDGHSGGISPAICINFRVADQGINKAVRTAEVSIW